MYYILAFSKKGTLFKDMRYFLHDLFFLDSFFPILFTFQIWEEENENLSIMQPSKSNQRLDFYVRNKKKCFSNNDSNVRFQVCNQISKYYHTSTYAFQNECLKNQTQTNNLIYSSSNNCSCKYKNFYTIFRRITKLESIENLK